MEYIDRNTADETGQTTAIPSSERVLFSAVLEPHRSASRQNLNIAVLIFALGSIPVSLFFWTLGAWPVSGFVGIDLVLLFFILRFHHWAGQEREIIHLTDQALTVEQVNCWGKIRGWSFSPYWLQVNIEEVDAYRNRLEIRYRDQALVIGNHLSVREKIELARVLRNRLNQLSVWSHSPA